MAQNEGSDIWDAMAQLPQELWGEAIDMFNAGIGRDIPNASAYTRLEYCVDMVNNNHQN